MLKKAAIRRGFETMQPQNCNSAQGRLSVKDDSSGATSQGEAEQSCQEHTKKIRDLLQKLNHELTLQHELNDKISQQAEEIQKQAEEIEKQAEEIQNRDATIESQKKEKARFEATIENYQLVCGFPVLVICFLIWIDHRHNSQKSVAKNM